MYLFHEIHCDDLLLEKQANRATWEGTRQLIERLVQTAEDNKVKLAIRFRHPFVEGSLKWAGADNPLADWEARGHEIGTHAHTRKIRRTAVALRQAGIKENLCVVPGLIQKQRNGVVRTINATRGLGFRYCTDQPQLGTFPYSGLTPWRPSKDMLTTGNDELLMIDVSVNPFDWGLLTFDGEVVGHRYGLRPCDFEALLSLLNAHPRLFEAPRVTYFGYPFHEHNHQKSMSDQTPNEASIAAWGDFLRATNDLDVTQALPREIYRAHIENESVGDRVEPSTPTRMARFDRMDLRHDVWSWALEQNRVQAGLRTGGAFLRGRAKAKSVLRRSNKTSILMRGDVKPIKVAGRSINVVRFGPKEATSAVCVSVSGLKGGTKVKLEPFGLKVRQITSQGIAVWLWDRSGTDSSKSNLPMEPGQRRHAREAAAVFRLAKQNSELVGWLTFSAGNIAPLMSLCFKEPEQPAFFIDVEGPSDRLSIRARTLGRESGDPMAEINHGKGPSHDHSWEPYRHVSLLTCSYHRIQGDLDHMHMRCSLHGEIMIEAAGPGSMYNNRPNESPRRRLEGSISNHGREILEAITGAVQP